MNHNQGHMHLALPLESSSRFIQDSLFNMNMYHSGDNT